MASSAEEEDRRSPVRAIITAAVLILVVLVLTIIGQVFFKDPLRDGAEVFIGSLGYPGIFIAVFLLDLLILPISPDVVLFLSIASGSEPLISLPLICTAAVLAGSTAYYLGRFLGRTRIIKRMIRKYERRGRFLVDRYGIWAVILAATTPMPYSTVAMIAGIMRMRYPEFLVGTLWRVPKILVWYVIMRVGFLGA